MRTYKVSFKGSGTPVGLVVRGGVVTRVHSDIEDAVGKKLEGRKIEEVKALVKKHKGSISKIK